MARNINIISVCLPSVSLHVQSESSLLQQMITASGSTGDDASTAFGRILDMASDIDAFEQETDGKLGEVSELKSMLDKINGFANELNGLKSELASMDSDLDRVNRLESEVAVLGSEPQGGQGYILASADMDVSLLCAMVVVLALLAAVLAAVVRGRRS